MTNADTGTKLMNSTPLSAPIFRMPAFQLSTAITAPITTM